MIYTQALFHGLLARNEQQNSGKRRDEFLQHFRAEKENFTPHGAMRKAMSYSSLESECSLEEEDEEEKEEASPASLHRELTLRLERCLVGAKKATLRCQELLLPSQMTQRVAAGVLRVSVGEPCGLRGAVIHLYLENDSGLQKLGTVTPESSLTPPTFELSVVFRPDAKGWPSLKRLFGTENILKLRPEYRLVKKKLYSSASPVITEFCN